MIHPAAGNQNLQVLVPPASGKSERYCEVDETLTFKRAHMPADAKAIRQKWNITPRRDGRRGVDHPDRKVRPPVAHPRFDDAWDAATKRGVLEIQSERFAT